jgi:uncharacterized protein YcfL
MKEKALILIIGATFLIGCSAKNASQRVDEDTRADMDKVYKTGQPLEKDGAGLVKDVSGTIKQSIRPK